MKYFSTHPGGQERVDSMQTFLKNFKKAENQCDKVQMASFWSYFKSIQQ